MGRYLDRYRIVTLTLMIGVQLLRFSAFLELMALRLLDVNSSSSGNLLEELGREKITYNSPANVWGCSRLKSGMGCSGEAALLRRAHHHKASLDSRDLL